MSLLNITTIQTNLHWENKTANLQMLEEKMTQHLEKRRSLCCLKMFSTGFSMRPEELARKQWREKTVQWIGKEWQQKRK